MNATYDAHINRFSRPEPEETDPKPVTAPWPGDPPPLTPPDSTPDTEIPLVR